MLLISSYLFPVISTGLEVFSHLGRASGPMYRVISRAMSSDVTTAYQQGVNEANLAVERFAELGLTKPDKDRFCRLL